jgi:hypothetical protein
MFLMKSQILKDSEGSVPKKESRDHGRLVVPNVRYQAGCLDFGLPDVESGVSGAHEEGQKANSLLNHC